MTQHPKMYGLALFSAFLLTTAYIDATAVAADRPGLFDIARAGEVDDLFKTPSGGSDSSSGQSQGNYDMFGSPEGGETPESNDPILEDLGSTPPGEPDGDGGSASGSNSAGTSSGSSDIGSTPSAGPGTTETTDVEAGTASNSEGTTKVIYQKDKNGRTVGVTYEHYNSKGEVTGRDHYDIDPETPDGESGNQPAADDDGTVDTTPADEEEEVSVEDDYRDPAPVPDGTFAGDFAGDAAGEIRFTINGNIIQGSMRGRYSNAPFRVQFTGTIDESGTFTAMASGSAHTTIQNVEGDYPVGGTIEGNVSNRSARGYWSGKASTMMSNAKGTWSASQYP